MKIPKLIIDVLKDLNERRHQIRIKSIHELEHDGVKYTVAKTNRGKLVLFPYAKKVTVHDVIEMMNRENGPAPYPESRRMEWRGWQAPLDTQTMGRTMDRVSGLFKIQSETRRGPVVVFRKVQKAIPGANTPLEEALMLQAAHKEGFRTEVPIAVFLGRIRFPDMVFTTRVKPTKRKGEKVRPISDWRLYAPKPDILPFPQHIRNTFEDAVKTGQDSQGNPRWTLIDAQFRTRENYENAKQLKRKLRRI